MENGQRQEGIKPAMKERPSSENGRGFKAPEPLVTKIEEKGGSGKKGRPIEGKAVKRIKEIIRRRRSKGEFLFRMKEEAGLNETERQVLEVYVNAQQRITRDEAVEKIGKSKVTITCALRAIENKLLGKDGRDHLVERYRKLSDEEIIQEIRRYGVRSRTQLQNKNYGLYKAAKEKEVLGRVFPKKDKGREEVRNELLLAFASATKERNIEEALSDLTVFQREIVEKIILSKAPVSVEDFAGQHEMEAIAVLNIMKRLARMLRRERVDFETLDRLKKCVEGLDGDKLSELKPLLKERELAILERRVLPRKPETLEKIGKSLHISRERVRQIEKGLLDKTETWKQTGKFERSRRARKTFDENGQVRNGNAGKLSDGALEIVRLRDALIFSLNLSDAAIGRIIKKELGNCYAYQCIRNLVKQGTIRENPNKGRHATAEQVEHGERLARTMMSLRRPS